MTTPPPYPDEAHRLEALRKYSVMDTLPEQALDDLTALAAHICGAPIALISLVDEHRQWFKAKVGMEVEETSRDVSFCAHALLEPDLFTVSDATQDARFAGNPLVTAKEGIRFYAGAPLVTPEGAALGTLCVIDRVPRILTPEQEQALRVLSRQVMTQLELRRRERELKASENKLRAIFEAGPNCVKLLRVDGTLHEMNEAGLRMVEADSLDVVAEKNLLPLVVPEDRAAVLSMLKDVLGGAQPTIQFRLITLKGTHRWVEMSGVPFPDEATGQEFVLGVSHDITERKLAEEKVQRLNHLYAVSSSVNEAIFRIHDIQKLYEEACRIAVEQGKLVMAWVGLVEADGRVLKPAARWGHDEGYLDQITVMTTPEERYGQGPAGRAFRTGEPAFCNDIEAGRETFASRSEALQRGFRSCAAFPLKRDGVSMGVLVVYGNQPGYFDREVLHVINSLAENISFALESNGKEEQRLRTEDALRESEERFRTFMEYSPAAGWVVDESGCFRYVSPGYMRMFRADEQLTGKRISEIYEPALSEVYLANNRAALDAGKVIETIEPGIRPDGSPGQFLSVKFPINLPGRESMLGGIALDITERKRTEERFRRLVDSNAQGVMFWKATGEISGANDAFLQIIGYSREDLEAGAVHWTTVTPLEYTEIDRRSQEEMATRGVCTPYEKEYTRKDGSRVPVLVGAAAFEDCPEEGVCFVLDLTERKKLEQQFLRSQRMESIGTLAGGIAHDLNNVLAPIILSIELLQMKFTDPASQHLISIIASSAQRGADMVRQVLSFARGVEGQRLEVQVRHLIQDIEKIINETFLKNIQVQTIIPHELWNILGDPTQLHQVLLNLCVNARDAMPNGGTLTLCAENVTIDAHYAAMNIEATPGPYIFLQVEDSGTGIPPDTIQKVFDPFFTTKELGKGTGLGLSTTLAIVKSHGGFIRVYSEEGKGTKFKVYLPAQTESSPELTSAQAAEMPRGNGELILIVDDEASVRQITQQTLEAFGYRVVLASDGAEGVAIFAGQSREIAVVLTDMMMPIMDGPATIKALRRISPKMRIIAASGLSANSHVENLGVKHFLPKPYTAETLLKVLRQILTTDP